MNLSRSISNSSVSIHHISLEKDVNKKKFFLNFMINTTHLVFFIAILGLLSGISLLIASDIYNWKSIFKTIAFLIIGIGIFLILSSYFIQKKCIKNQVGLYDDFFSSKENLCQTKEKIEQLKISSNENHKEIAQLKEKLEREIIPCKPIDDSVFLNMIHQGGSFEIKMTLDFYAMENELDSLSDLSICHNNSIENIIYAFDYKYNILCDILTYNRNLVKVYEDVLSDLKRIKCKDYFNKISCFSDIKWSPFFEKKGDRILKLQGSVTQLGLVLSALDKKIMDIKEKSQKETAYLKNDFLITKKKIIYSSFPYLKKTHILYSHLSNTLVQVSLYSSKLKDILYETKKISTHVTSKAKLENLLCVLNNFSVYGLMAYLDRCKPMYFNQCQEVNK